MRADRVEACHKELKPAVARLLAWFAKYGGKLSLFAPELAADAKAFAEGWRRLEAEIEGTGAQGGAPEIRL